MKYLFLACSLLLAGFTTVLGAGSSWRQADRIVKSIRLTSIPNHEVSITDFGAVRDDANRPVHEAINAAVRSCHEKGGGRVIVPAGVFYTGPIRLLSNVELHLKEGAELRFSTNYNLYYPGVKTRWEGMDAINATPLIYAADAENIAITGKGIIDGQASNEKWWYMKGRKDYGWRKGLISQEEGGRDRLLQHVREQTPIDQRRMTLEDGLRPQLINFMNCERILLEGVTLLRSPFWVIHPVFCKDLIVRGVHINSDGPNSDGCDPESCENVLIENCFFNTGDDCIAIKSGRNEDGRGTRPSRNIVVRNCKMENGHGGVVIGSEISGGCNNVYVENCEMDSPQLDRVIRIKTSMCRGGVIEDIFARNIKVGECREAVLRINLNYENNENCVRDFPPVVRNVYLENIVCNKSRHGIYMDGLSGQRNIYGIEVKNCRFDNVAKENVRKGESQVTFRNTTINGKNAD